MVSGRDGAPTGAVVAAAARTAPRPVPSPRPRMLLRRARRVPLVLFAVASAVAPCAARAQNPAPSAAQPAQAWPVRTREHVDLWLHGFALVVDDTARVPIFRRGYRAEVRARRARVNAFTQLDAERDRLRARLAANPPLAINAQFAALAFGSWEELRAAADVLVQAAGDPRRARDERSAQAIAVLATFFPAAPDREWLRIFAGALQDERDKFFHQDWLAVQRDRAGALAAADSVWRRRVLPRLGRYLGGTQQKSGELLLSPVIGGEGRTQQGGPTSGGARGTSAVVALPARPADAAEASYAAVHEVVGAVVGPVIQDNTSPADQRTGVADRYVSAGQVRAGYLLLQRTAPDLAAGYARFYLREAGLPAPAVGGEGAALAAAFPLPQPILDAIVRQLELVEGGI